MAPEMIQNKAHNHTLDIWSLGILLYELVHGKAPFTGVHPREISEKIMAGNIRFKPGVTADYKDLVLAILKANPTERIPLVKVFDHPWIRNFEKKYNLKKVVAAPVKPPSISKEQVDKKRADQEAKEKSLAEAAAKKKLAEQEAAAKEAERQEKLR
mmetsp:Transcript_27947/g.42245  ORF Transcript_27947/g.42245 Transcript_27947/m.42245 type:complete len:156 (+) Transcript_27947:1085-1552(+)